MRGGGGVHIAQKQRKKPPQNHRIWPEMRGGARVYNYFFRSLLPCVVFFIVWVSGYRKTGGGGGINGIRTGC